MRVLLVSKFLHHVGGVETYIDWLGGNLPKVGIETAFFGMTPPPGKSALPGIIGPVTYTPYRDFNDGSGVSRALSAANSIYSLTVSKLLHRAINEFRPDLIHYHGTCFQLTSSVATVAARLALPAVITAHEYKLFCANQRVWNDRTKTPCFDCAGVMRPSQRSRHILENRCVKGSLAASAIAAVEQPISERSWAALNPIVHTPSQFMRDILIQSGWDPNRIHHLDLAWDLPGALTPKRSSRERNFTVGYFGRLAPEKGIDLLLRSWPEFIRMTGERCGLRIYGDGAELPRLRKLANELGLEPAIFAGPYDHSQISSLLDSVDVTVHPAVWAENSPYSVRESLMHGVPAVVSDRGGLREMVSPETGTVIESLSRESVTEALLSEWSLRRARTAELVAAVADRAISFAEHLTGLASIYEKALD